MPPLSLSGPPDLVIFDCDGVLVDSEGPMHEVLCAELQLHGVRLSLDECLEHFMGKSIEGVIETATDLGADLPAGWKDTLYRRVHARLISGVELIPGIRELVQALKDRAIPFCVASNGSEAKMQLMLSQHGLWEDFRDNCFSAQTLGVSKPDPGLLRHVLKAMGHPANPVVIEDSLVGIQSAAAAGIPCFVYSGRTTQPIPAGETSNMFASIPNLSRHILSA